MADHSIIIKRLGGTQAYLLDAVLSREKFLAIFTARRYASAVYAMVLCQSVFAHLSQVGILSKRLNDSSFLPHIRHYIIKNFWYLQNIRNYFRNSKLENFAAASRLCCQQNSSTVKLVHHTYMMFDA